MIPIYEQGQRKGIGHSLDTFLARFDAICQEHVNSGRAKAFAFIFYDFVDQDLRRILKDQGVFAQLDRLSGNSLSIFYLHTATQHAIQKLNSAFLTTLGVEGRAAPPCVVFFTFKKDQLQDVAVAQLDSANLVLGFHELYCVIQRYIEGGGMSAGKGLRSLQWLKSGAAFFTVEAFRVALRKSFENLL
jgi:hypothetical protein